MSSEYGVSFPCVSISVAVLKDDRDWPNESSRRMTPRAKTVSLSISGLVVTFAVFVSVLVLIKLL